jgi:hypothetical protein
LSGVQRFYRERLPGRPDSVAGFVRECAFRQAQVLAT